LIWSLPAKSTKAGYARAPGRDGMARDPAHSVTVTGPGEVVDGLAADGPGCEVRGDPAADGAGEQLAGLVPADGLEAALGVREARAERGAQQQVVAPGDHLAARPADHPGPAGHSRPA